MTPPHTASFPSREMSQEESDNPILMVDTTRRLGRLEAQVSEILPVLGRVDEAVANQSAAIADIKADVKEIAGYFTTMKIDCAKCSVRINDLEKRNDNYSADKIVALKEAKDKAEAIVNLKEKEHVEVRNKRLQLVGTAVASVVTAAVLTWLGLK